MKMIKYYGAGDTLTNSTVETVLASHVFPANFWHVGKVVDLCGAVYVADNNSTDTLTVDLKLGATTLTGTDLATSGAVDVADADACPFRVRLVCTTAGSAGVIESVAWIGSDAAGTAPFAQYTSVSSLDTTGALRFEVTGDWSVAHADNQCAAKFLTVEEGSAL